MKIVTWNCQGALHNKIDDFLLLIPALAVIPKMASPAVLRNKLRSEMNFQAVWIGQGANKRLGVLINTDWRLKCFRKPIRNLGQENHRSRGGVFYFMCQAKV